jgi:hypothetical protein
MKSALVVCLALFPLAGCQLPPERPPLRPLPAEVQPLPYAELLTRTRNLGIGATEALYVNRWADVEDIAKDLEQTARFLGKAEDVPARNKDKLADVSADLGKEAIKLREAARVKNVDEANDTLARINKKVRELRLEN